MLPNMKQPYYTNIISECVSVNMCRKGVSIPSISHHGLSPPLQFIRVHAPTEGDLTQAHTHTSCQGHALDVPCVGPAIRVVSGYTERKYSNCQLMVAHWTNVHIYTFCGFSWAHLHKNRVTITITGARTLTHITGTYLTVHHFSYPRVLPSAFHLTCDDLQPFIQTEPLTDSL